MKISMVRHGETDSNVAKRIMGNRVDDPLNENGIRQAEELAASLSDREFDVIYASPLKRAAQTAEIIAGAHKTPIIFRDELKERDFGSLTGKTFEEADTLTNGHWNELKLADRAQQYDYREYGGESAEDVKKRFLSCIAEIKEKYADKQVLLVAHAGIIRLAYRLFRDMPVDKIKNASIEEFDI